MFVRLTEKRAMESVLVLLHDDVDHDVRTPSKIEDSRWRVQATCLTRREEKLFHHHVDNDYDLLRTQQYKERHGNLRTTVEGVRAKSKKTYRPCDLTRNTASTNTPSIDKIVQAATTLWMA